MAYPKDKPSGNYVLRDSNFAELDANKIPMDNGLWKTGYRNAEESEVESVPDAHEQNWLFDVLHRNLRYTQETAEENKRLLETKVATPTDIGQVKIGYGLEITAGGVLSVAKDVAADANIVSYDLPVGSYMLWSGKNTPEYFIEPSGQTLLRSSYPELWEFAQDNGLVGTLFGSGNGSTTFTVTDIRGSFISIANSNEKVGRFNEAGLPNITGEVSSFWCGGPTGSNIKGAFGSKGHGATYGGGTSSGVGFDFDASRSNSIYGKSETVTPANWGLKIILKALPTPPSNAVPTGTILDYTGSSAPDGYVIANGAELSRTTFSRLWQWATANGLVVDKSKIPTTAHAFYGTGDGSTTFTIPDLRGVQKTSADLASNRVKKDLGQFATYDFGAGVIPDYSKAYDATAQTYTAPADGIYYCSFAYNEAKPSRCYVNDVEMSRYWDYEGEGGLVTTPFTIVVKKGDVIRWQHSGVRFGRFFPFKNKTSGFGAVATTPILKY